MKTKLEVAMAALKLVSRGFDIDPAFEADKALAEIAAMPDAAPSHISMSQVGIGRASFDYVRGWNECVDASTESTHAPNVSKNGAEIGMGAVLGQTCSAIKELQAAAAPVTKDADRLAHLYREELAHLANALGTRVDAQLFPVLSYSEWVGAIDAAITKEAK